jgi:hypothetical protein
VGEGPFPGLVVSPGHDQTPWQWVQEFDGAELLRRGFALVIPSIRVSLADQDEVALALYFARVGMSFAGVRVYEQLLAEKLAAATPEIDPCRIGLLSHSGGAIIGNVTARLSHGLKAFVGDHVSTYMAEPQPGLWLDETSPGLYRYHRLVNRVEGARVPSLTFGYGYKLTEEPFTDQRPQAWDFLEKHVSNAYIDDIVLPE